MACVWIAKYAFDHGCKYLSYTIKQFADWYVVSFSL